MKKIITVFVICALALSTAESSAQIFYKGIKGGLNFSNLKGFDDISTVDNLQSYTGFHAGIFLGVNLVAVKVQADVLYSLQGVRFEDVNSPGDAIDLENSYVNIPIMAKVSLAPIVNVQAGIQYAFLTKSVIDGTADYPIDGTNNINVKDLFTSGYGSLMVGLGFDISKLMIEARYDLGISDINNNSLTAEKLKNGNLQLSLGIKL